MSPIPPPTSAMQPVLRALRLPQFGWGSKIAALVLAIIVVLTLLAVMAALLPGDTLTQRLAGLETEHLVIAALGLAVVATRFWRR